jgi:serine/threonine protein kinase/tetratricopeptide (TPR) repeat protein
VPAPNEKWNQFELLESLGKGGMGEVFLARDTSLDRKVALKVLSHELQKDSAAQERFRREAKSAAALDHPYICKIYEVGEAKGQAYIAMEFVEGVTLAEKLREGALSLPDVLRIGAEVAEAASLAHQRNIVHRDLKALNIMVTPEGHAKVMDFGIALHVGTDDPETDADTLSHRLSSHGATPGTVIYMSPEQVRGEPLDGRSDIFSLGTILYEMATGRLPFQGATSGLTYDAILNRGPEPPRSVNPDLPVELEQIVMKALEKSPEERYQSAKEIVVDLRRLSRDSGVMPSPRPQRRRKRFLPVVATLVGVAFLGALLYFVPSRATPTNIRSLAVLPFDNSRNDPDVDYLSDGIAETLINRLSQIGDLQVMARSTAFRYRGAAVDPQQAGRELGVGAVITGRVVQQESRVNVQAELVDVDTGRQLWGEQYSHEIADLASLQNAIAREISRALRIELTGEEEAELQKSPTENPEAYRAYLRGRHHWNQRTKEDFKRAIAYFEEARNVDPAYALAYVGLADCYILLGGQFYGQDPDFPPKVANEKAREAALEAIRLDDTLAEPRATLGWIAYLVDWDFAGAESLFREANVLDPSYVTTHHYYAYLLSSQGRHEEAIQEAVRTVELEPSSPLYNRTLGMIFHQARRYDEAVAQLEKTLRLDPEFPLAQGTLINAHWLAGRSDDAIGLAWQSDPQLAELLTLVREGKHSEAHVALDAFDWNQRTFTEWAQYYAIAGDRDRLFEGLEAALAEHHPLLPFVVALPQLDSESLDPRLIDLKRRIGFLKARRLSVQHGVASDLASLSFRDDLDGEDAVVWVNLGEVRLTGDENLSLLRIERYPFEAAQRISVQGPKRHVDAPGAPELHSRETVHQEFSGRRKEDLGPLSWDHAVRVLDEAFALESREAGGGEHGRNGTGDRPLDAGEPFGRRSAVTAFEEMRLHVVVLAFSPQVVDERLERNGFLAGVAHACSTHSLTRASARWCRTRTFPGVVSSASAASAADAPCW